MRPLERVYILVEPRGLDNPKSPREFYEYDRLADELSRELTLPVQVIETWLRDVPRDGMLLVADDLATNETLIEDARTATPGLPRPILLGLSRGDVQLSEPARLAGVVIGDQLMSWVLRQKPSGMVLFYGLKSLAPYLPPTFEPIKTGKETPLHTYYRCKNVGSLPVMLARYIEAYWQHGID
jgi:hypothetical protein